jgi:hypothetical protein
MENTLRLRGRDAINYAEANDLLLSKYADPIEEDREGLTISEANKVAWEDPALIYLDISATDPCDRCGGTLALGYELRYYGTDLETGDCDSEFVCNHCMGKDADESAFQDEE